MGKTIKENWNQFRQNKHLANISLTILSIIENKKSYCYQILLYLKIMLRPIHYDY